MRRLIPLIIIFLLSTVYWMPYVKGEDSNFSPRPWEQLSLNSNPPPLENYGIAYDSKCAKTIIFGGNSVRLSDETWSFDYNTKTWKNMHPKIHPSAQIGHVMVYNSYHDRIILFGCSSKNGPGETWAYNYKQNIWQNMSPE